MNEKQARKIVEKFNPCDNAGDDSDLIYAKGYLLALEQMRPFILAFEALATGACEKKGCSVVARQVLAQWNEGQNEMQAL